MPTSPCHASNSRRQRDWTRSLVENEPRDEAGEEQEREITGCKRRIEAELGEPMISLSYPDGGRDSFDGNTRRILAENDVEFGFSYYGGYRSFSDWDPYDVRRRWLSRSVTRDRFALMLTLPQVFTWR